MRKRATLVPFLVALSLLGACATPPGAATRPDEYSVLGATSRMPKGDAERHLIERYLADQIRPPLDNPLRFRQVVLPSYPAAWKRLRQVPEKVVAVRFVVSESGLVANPTVIGDADPELVQLCLTALESWQFEPATRDGKPVNVRLAFQFIFRALKIEA